MTQCLSETFFLSPPPSKKNYILFSKNLLFSAEISAPYDFWYPVRGVGNILQTKFCISELQIRICFRDKKKFLLAYLEKKYEIAARICFSFKIQLIFLGQRVQIFFSNISTFFSLHWRELYYKDFIQKKKLCMDKNCVALACPLFYYFHEIRISNIVQHLTPFFYFYLPEIIYVPPTKKYWMHLK